MLHQVAGGVAGGFLLLRFLLQAGQRGGARPRSLCRRAGMVVDLGRVARAEAGGRNAVAAALKVGAFVSAADRESALEASPGGITRPETSGRTVVLAVEVAAGGTGVTAAPAGNVIAVAAVARAKAAVMSSSRVFPSISSFISKTFLAF